MKSCFSKDYISLADLYLAYRKAKAEAFFDNTNPSALAFADYEQKLEYNLKQLLIRVTASKIEWPKEIDFLGGYSYAPKSINISSWEKPDSVYYRAIDPIEEWNGRFERNGSKKITAKYRLIITATVNFQIISAMWILKVGHLFEEALNQELSYGNRLRRYQAGPFTLSGTSGQLNRDCLGLFQPYFSAYKKWRENGLIAMQNAIYNGQSINAITMDLASFYHNVSPKFLLRDKFLAQLHVALSNDEKAFTAQLIHAIETWYSSTPDFPDRSTGALPVGLSASKVISNILLHQFDEQMVNGLKPLYYGRYVDDIFLVVKSPDSVRDGADILSWIHKHVPCLEKLNDGTLKVNFPYAKDSDLCFAGDKQKIFYLSSEHGIDLVDQILTQIRKQSSEYRMLADVPDTATEMASRALLATPSASLEADALRKADVVSVRRLGFSLLLVDIENYAKDLMPSAWQEVRSEFYGLVHRHLLTPTGLFEFTNYYHRIFGLMISCGDFDDASSFVENLKQCFDLLQRTTTDCTDGEDKIQACKGYFVKILVQSALQASTAKGFSNWTKLGRLLRQLFQLDESYKIPSRKDSLTLRGNELLLADLGTRPYKDFWYYSQTDEMRGIRVPKARDVRRVLRLAAIRRFRIAADLKSPHWPALAFPTRPLTIQEIALISPKVLEDFNLFQQAIRGLRGARVRSIQGIGFEIKKDAQSYNRILTIPSQYRANTQQRVRVALTSLKTTDKQWEGAVKGKPDRSLSRYRNLLKLVNRILKEENRPNYLVFPECSIPRRWAFSMAHKLARNGVSLLCGLEYYKDKSETKLRNDCFISLTTQWPGYLSSIIYIQPKLEPAHNEKQSLKSLGKQLFISRGGSERLPIYNHGGFHFGLLICSDMTNIENRSHFQGKVDGLFVLEWNPDVNTFSFLVEGAAHDIHAFVIQVNNRTYGDSRIRAPFDKEHNRDSIRIKGGISDFYVIGDVDYMALRKFQKQGKPVKDPLFKPVPIGFKMASWRKKTT